jgi:PAS domain S-box-containing protein
LAEHSDRPDRLGHPGRRDLRRHLLGFGKRSFRKSYYSQLQQQIAKHERFRALLDASHDAFFLIRRQGMEIMDCNQGACKLLGREHQEVLHTDIREQFDVEDRPAVARCFDGHCACEQLEDAIAVRLKPAEGDPVPVEVNILWQEFDGERFALVVARDMRQQRDIEEQLRFSQGMESMGRLAGGIAHDFNNLLGVIIGYSELALAEVDERDPLRGALEQIRAAGNRASELTRQLLLFSRNQPSRREVFEVDQVVAAMERIIRRVIGEDVQFTTRLEAVEGRIRGSRGQTEQVLLNLAVNARDAMPRGGRLEIETRNVNVAEAVARRIPDLGPGPHVAIAVRDSGHGMDEATRARAFEPFFTTKETGKGTGLGLSTVYGIVKQAGGGIRLHSQPGSGTELTVLLPRVEEEAESEPAPAPVRGGSGRILLVEDDAAVLELVARMLRQLGYSVVSARSPAEAVGLFEDVGDSIRMMISDVVMPGGSGPELYETLRSRRPALRALFMSGFLDEERLRHGLTEAEVDFLHKPFGLQELAQSVRECLDRPCC